ncbi:MAG TPA: hypothetical protein VG055_29945 [Planctomycetaceae bacterium]|jgi:hypothetical protein|nr:hypothetical protein [Planctomycetaceae bacterium]
MCNPRILATMGIVLWTAWAIADGQPQAATGSNDRRDAAVLEVVLQDLLARDVVELPKGAAKQLLFSTEALDSEQAPIRAEDVLQEFPQTILAEVSGGKTLFANLSQEQSKLVREAAEQLARRATTKDAIKPFVPKDKRIKMYSKKVAKEYPKNVGEQWGPQLFCARQPGYSNNRQLAIVVIAFGWSNNRHPVLARYILIKKHGGWIVLRASIYFFV